MRSFLAFVLIGFPVFVSAQLAPNSALKEEKGVSSYQSYEGSREDVNLADGNLHISIPLLHLPGRAGHDLDLSLNYDSKAWELDHGYQSTGPVNYFFWQMTGGTWHVNAPILSWTTVITGTTLDISHQNVPPSDGCVGGCGAEDIPDPGDDSQPYAPQGTQHPIPRSNLGPIGAPSPHAECAGNFSVTLMDGSIHSFALPGAFVDCYSVYGGQVARDFGADIKRAAAVDGSQIGIDLTNLSDVVVSLPNGNTLHFDLSGPSGLSAWNGSPALAKAIVDSNGNVISLVGTGASISSITDTVGRTITFGPIISAIATGFLPSYISYSDQNASGGIVTRTITINPRSDVHLAPQFVSRRRV